MKRKLTAALLALVLILTVLPAGALAAPAAAAPFVRYCVLVMDVSGSMSGTPIRVQKQAAQRFCEDVTQEGDSYVALVAFDDRTSVLCDFTNDLEELRNCIDRTGSGGGTNISAALTQAGNLLAGASAPAGTRVVRNIILCTDGVPQSGPTSSTGPFTSSESSWSYANAVCAAAEPLKAAYNIYTLGFFHDLSGSTRASAQKLLTLVQNAGYHEITDPDILGFIFGDIIGSILNTSRQDPLTNAIANYALNGFHADDERMPLPAGSTDYRNFTNTFGNLAAHAAQDPAGVQADMAAACGLAAGSNAELLLADLLTGPHFRSMITAGAENQYMNGLTAVLSALLQLGYDDMDAVAAAAGVPAGDSALAGNWTTLGIDYDTLIQADDIQQFQNLFGSCSAMLNYCFKNGIPQSFLDALIRDSAQNGISVESLREAQRACPAPSSASDLIRCYACLEAYLTAIRMFSQVMEFLASSAAGMRSQATDAAQYEVCAQLADAASAFSAQAASVPLDLAAAGQALMQASPDAFGAALSAAVYAQLGSAVPALQTLADARQAAGSSAVLLTGAITQTNADLLPTLIYDMYTLQQCAVEAAGSYAEMLKTAQGSDKFYGAYGFDLAWSLWKNAGLALCSQAAAYEQQQTQNWLAQIDPQNPSQPVQDEYTWCSAAYLLAKTEAKRLNALDSHEGFKPLTQPLSLSGRLQIIAIACPVDVIVKNERGTQIALLTDTSQEIAEDYAPYFDVLPTSASADDFLKLCLIQDGWNVSFRGSGDGQMLVSRADVQGGAIAPASAQAAAVRRGTEGHLTAPDPATGGLLVIDSPGGGFHITFDPAGGTVSAASALTDAAGHLASLPVPVRSEYTFTGWLLPDGSAASASTVFTADTVLKAGWKSSTGSLVITPGLGPETVPALAGKDGYEAAAVNGRAYYTQASGAKVKVFLENAAGQMTRVAVPYTASADGSRYYPISVGGQTLSPRITAGRASAYCTVQGGISLPVLRVVSAPAADQDGGYQTIEVNGRAYYAKASGAKVQVYMKNAAGNMTRVAVPYAAGEGGRRYYPVSAGGIVLFPEMAGSRLIAYSAFVGGSRQPVLIPAA